MWERNGGLSCVTAECRAPSQKCWFVGPVVLFQQLYTATPHKAGLLEEEALCSVIYACSEDRGLKRQPLLMFLGYQKGFGLHWDPEILLRGTKKRSLYLSFGGDLRLCWAQCRHGEGSPAATSSSLGPSFVSSLGWLSDLFSHGIFTSTRRGKQSRNFHLYFTAEATKP